MKHIILTFALITLFSKTSSTQCTLPGEIFILQTFADNANGVFNFTEDSPGSQTFNFTTQTATLSTTLNVTFGMDVNPTTGVWYIAASPDGDNQNRHLYTFDQNTGVLSSSLGQIFSSSGRPNLQAFTFDGSGNLWGSFALGGGVSTVEIIDLNTLTGTASIINFGNGLSTGIGAVGMTWDFDNNQILLSSLDNITNGLDLFAINPSSMAVSTIISDLAVGNCSNGAILTLQGMDYVGNNQIYSTMTFGCDEIHLFDISTQTFSVLANPILEPIQTDSFKDLVYVAGCNDNTMAGETIPTLSQWGLISLAILMLIFGIMSIRQKDLSLNRA